VVHVVVEKRRQDAGATKYGHGVLCPFENFTED